MIRSHNEGETTLGREDLVFKELLVDHNEENQRNIYPHPRSAPYVMGF